MEHDTDRTPGKRLEDLRRRRGWSRRQLGDQVGKSTETIKAYELGKRRVSLSAAQELGRALHLKDLGELLGPSVSASLDAAPSHPGVPDVRRALTSWTLRPQGQPQTPAYLDNAVDAAWREWHTSRTQRTNAGLALPRLLDETGRAARLLDGQDRRAALTSYAEALHLAQAYLAWHGDRELVWMAVDRAMAASRDADDPLSIARSCWYTTHLLRAVGRHAEGLELLDEARQLTEPSVADGGPEWAEMLADIEMCDGLTRARSGDQGAWAHLEKARRIVRQALPVDYVGVRTRVSRALVDVYAVMYAVDLGDSDQARTLSRDLDPARIPSTERRGRHYVELARVADLEGSPEATLTLLRRAFDTSPETVQYSPAALELTRQLAWHAPASVRADAETLAREVGVVLD